MELTQFEKIKYWLKNTIRKLKQTPMDKVFSYLKNKNYPVDNYTSLEVFGAGGQHHTVDIYKNVKHLDIWEIDHNCEKALKKYFPKAGIKITDSYIEITKTCKKYDLVIIDNPTMGTGNHYEHFDLFPSIFSILEDNAILILNIMPSVMKASEIRLKKRRDFYRCFDPKNITFSEIEKTYRSLASDNGFSVTEIFYEERKRWDFIKKRDKVYYGVISLQKTEDK